MSHFGLTGAFCTKSSVRIRSEPAARRDPIDELHWVPSCVGTTKYSAPGSGKHLAKWHYISTVVVPGVPPAPDPRIGRVAAARYLPRVVRGTLRGDPILLPRSPRAASSSSSPSRTTVGFSATTGAAVRAARARARRSGLVTLPARGRPSRRALLGRGLLAGFALWSYLSITWADQNADAWDGANRTALYAIVFALFALWPLGSRGAAAARRRDRPRDRRARRSSRCSRSHGGRRPARLLRRRPARLAGQLPQRQRRALVPRLLAVRHARGRGASSIRRCAASSPVSAVVLAGTALLGQSRGWLFALPLVVDRLPARSRRPRQRAAWALIARRPRADRRPPARARRRRRLRRGARRRGGPLDDAVRAILLAAPRSPASRGAAAALVDRRARPSADVARRTGLGLAASRPAVVLLIGAVAFVAARRRPGAWAGDRWDEFKGGAQPRVGRRPPDPDARLEPLRLLARRLNQFKAHPITGRRRRQLPPRLPRRAPQRRGALLPALAGRAHAVARPGSSGALLLFGGVRAALLAAALRAIRSAPASARPPRPRRAHLVRLLPHPRRRSTGSGSCRRSACIAFALLGIAVGARAARRHSPAARARARGRSSRRPRTAGSPGRCRARRRVLVARVPPALAVARQRRRARASTRPAATRARRSTSSTAPRALNPFSATRACYRPDHRRARPRRAGDRRLRRRCSSATRATSTRTSRSPRSPPSRAATRTPALARRAAASSARATTSPATRCRSLARGRAAQHPRAQRGRSTQR